MKVARKDQEKSFKPTAMDAKKLRKLMKDRKEKLPYIPPEKRKTQESEQNIYPGKCRVCGGDLIDTIETEFRRGALSDIIGPAGGRRLVSFHNGYHCKECGVCYEFIPKQKEGLDNT